jgi:hypothetical protein
MKALRGLIAAAALGLLAGCAVYPDEVSDGYGGFYGGAYYDDFYYYPGHYYSYYPGYYAYCPPVHVRRDYWAYWRQHRHWPDGWNRWHGDRGHAGNWHRDRNGHGRPDRGEWRGRGDGHAQAAEQGQSAQSVQDGKYRVPRLASNPSQIRGQFNRARASARSQSAAGWASRDGGNWRGGGHGMSKADRRAGRAGIRSSAGGRTDAGARGSYRGSSSGSGGPGLSGGGSRGGGGSHGGRGR